MNKEWSDKNRAMQSLLKKDTFEYGIKTLFELRDILMKEMLSWQELPKEDFYKIPFPNANGYHSKTIAYSLWHIFRIEDIVLHSLIKKEKEILFLNSYDKKINSPIITTGNELMGLEISEFSKKLNIEALYQYIQEVNFFTTVWLKELEYPMLKEKFTESDKARIKNLGVVSDDENANWLIDYWCNKDIKGLIKMPFSRHWIMHVEASMKIINKLRENTQKCQISAYRN